MTQSFSNEIPSPTPHFICECYKKLEAFGIPLYVADENDFYTESPKIIPYENAFKLPGFLELKNVSQYPIVEECDLPFVFEQMAHILPALSDFEQNVLSFWILDVFIEGLRAAQNAKMVKSHQKATLLWIAYFFNFIQEQNPSQKDLFNHLKALLFCPDNSDENLGETERTIAGDGESVEGEARTKSGKIWKLPLPPDIYRNFNDLKSFSSDNHIYSESETEEAVKSSVSSQYESPEEETDTETNIKNMKIILEILYRIFARLWVYLGIRTVFHSMPSIEEVDLPFTLNVPKPLYKPEPAVPVKAEKGKRPSFSDKSMEESETEKQLHKNDYILPLQTAEESKLYLKQISGLPGSDRSMFNKYRDDRSKK